MRECPGKVLWEICVKHLGGKKRRMKASQDMCVCIKCSRWSRRVSCAEDCLTCLLLNMSEWMEIKGGTKRNGRFITLVNWISASVGGVCEYMRAWILGRFSSRKLSVATFEKDRRTEGHQHTTQQQLTLGDAFSSNFMKGTTWQHSFFTTPVIFLSSQTLGKVGWIQGVTVNFSRLQKEIRSDTFPFER